MQWLPSDRPTIEAAINAFRSGDWRSARGHFETAISTGRGDAGAYALLASCLFNLGEPEAALTAADEALSRDKSQLRAMIVKADVLAKQGERRDANVYYGAIVGLAEQMPRIPPDLEEGVRRAITWRDRLKSDMADHVRAELAAAGYVESDAPTRFNDALGVLTGEKKLYVQQPRVFHYPGLPTVEFYPREQFPWLDAVEASTDVIAEELTGILHDDERFAPYVQSQANMRYDTPPPLLDSLDWSSCFIWKDGIQTENLERCPRTMAALADAPLCKVRGRSPLVMFSQLRAGAHITPHTGVLNTRLLCHLPLIVPPGCTFRVGNTVREWEKGKAWLFNDSIEHEAFNTSDRTRVILIFDVWRPELSEEERRLITRLLEAMDHYSPQTTWD